MPEPAAERLFLDPAAVVLTDAERRADAAVRPALAPAAFELADFVPAFRARRFVDWLALTQESLRGGLAGPPRSLAALDHRPRPANIACPHYRPVRRSRQTRDVDRIASAFGSPTSRP